MDSFVSNLQYHRLDSIRSIKDIDSRSRLGVGENVQTELTIELDWIKMSYVKKFSVFFACTLMRTLETVPLFRKIFQWAILTSKVFKIVNETVRTQSIERSREKISMLCLPFLFGLELVAIIDCNFLSLCLWKIRCCSSQKIWCLSTSNNQH